MKAHNESVCVTACVGVNEKSVRVFSERECLCECMYECECVCVCVCV